MTNKEKLIHDLPLIAENHKLNADVEEFANDQADPCIYGGCNVPTLTDVKMLCSSVGISEDCIVEDWYGIEIVITEDWHDNVMNRVWTPQYELWLRADQTTVEM